MGFYLNLHYDCLILCYSPQYLFFMLCRSCDLLRASCCFCNLLNSSLLSDNLPVTSYWPVATCQQLSWTYQLSFSLFFFLDIQPHMSTSCEETHRCIQAHTHTFPSAYFTILQTGCGNLAQVHTSAILIIWFNNDTSHVVHICFCFVTHPTVIAFCILQVINLSKEHGGFQLFALKSWEINFR